MTVLDWFKAKLKHNQGKGSNTFVKECVEELIEAGYVNTDNYTSRRRPDITYKDFGTASLARLIEMKKVSNDSIDRKAGFFSKDYTSRIRQGKIIPKKLDLAKICIALELQEKTIIRLFNTFGYTYDISSELADPLDYCLHKVINESDLKTAESRMEMFNSLMS